MNSYISWWPLVSYFRYLSSWVGTPAVVNMLSSHSSCCILKFYFISGRMYQELEHIKAGTPKTPMWTGNGFWNCSMGIPLLDYPRLIRSKGLSQLRKLPLSSLAWITFLKWHGHINVKKTAFICVFFLSDRCYRCPTFSFWWRKQLVPLLMCKWGYTSTLEEGKEATAHWWHHINPIFCDIQPQWQSLPIRHPL